MERIFHYTISEKENNMPIDSFLRSMGYSRQNITALKAMPESILVNGRWEYVIYKLKTGEHLTIHIQETESSPNIVPTPLPLSIVYEDADILVVDKPAGMSIHPSQNHYENTLANAVMHYYASQNIPYTFRCINRLDQYTTGLTILAKHMYSASILSDMVAKREIKREYLAIVSGTGLETEGTVNAPIARLNGSTIERTVDEVNGTPSITHYKVLLEVGEYSLLSLWLETGRTHQIRVHMKHIGHPLPGDFLYHPDMRYINRQALHSHRLTFAHPITKELLVFESPLPEDMQFIYTL